MSWDFLASRGRGRSRLNWSDGYVVDAPYIEPPVFDLCPAWLSMAAVLHGQPPLDMTRPLTWMDLGAGGGLSACIVAAANPTVNVWGYDYNPSHVERARNLARRASLTNCTFDEATFADLAVNTDIGPSDVDVIVVHGVYSWVSPANQRHIVEIIRQRLKPGGLAYLMYEAPSGWSSMTPLAEALHLHAKDDGRPNELAFHDAAAAVKVAAGEGATFAPVGPREMQQVESWATLNPRYAAHEYLGGHFAPLMFDQVASVMASARCSYLGSIDMTDHMSAYWAPPDLSGLVTSTQDTVLREMLRDLIVQRPLRRDLYRRGLGMANPLENEEWLHDLNILGSGKVFDDRPVELPAGGISLDAGLYAPLIGALDSRMLNAATILEIHTEWNLADAVSALALLVAGGYAAPAVAQQPGDEARAASRRLNEVLIGENRNGADHGLLVAPGIGSAIQSGFVEMWAVGHVWNGHDPDTSEMTTKAIAELARQGRTLHEDGVSMEGKSLETAVHGRVERSLGHIQGLFTQLGIC